MMRFQIVIGLIIVIIVSGCGPKALINETQPIANQSWAFAEPAAFSLEVSDTISTYNYSIQLRHGGDYKYRNLILYFKTFYPNNTYIIDTVDCPLAEPSGRWLGSGLGDIIDNRILFKINQQFNQPGAYKFEIQHAMREDTIHEIYDVGLLLNSVSN